MTVGDSRAGDVADWHSSPMLFRSALDAISTQGFSSVCSCQAAFGGGGGPEAVIEGTSTL